MDRILWEDEGELSCEGFFERIYSRFGPSELDNFTGELVKLQHIGTVLEYQIETLLSKSRVSLEQRVTFFFNGLRDSLRHRVQICRPQTLHAAVCLVKKYKQQGDAQRRMRFPWLEKKRMRAGFSDNRLMGEANSKDAGIWNQSVSETHTIIKLLPSEIQERQKMCLCFTCDEKY